jgi:hypothetical protein
LRNRTLTTASTGIACRWITPAKALEGPALDIRMAEFLLREFFLLPTSLAMSAEHLLKLAPGVKAPVAVGGPDRCLGAP